MGVNPALMSMPGMYSGNNYNDDMAQYMYSNMPQQSFTGGAQNQGLALPPQPVQDSFSYSGAAVTAAAGTAAGVGAYKYFNANPMKDGKFTDDFLKIISERHLGEKLADAKDAKVFEKLKGVYGGKIKDQKVYRAIEEFSKGEKAFKDLSKEVKDLIPKEFHTKAKAKAFIDKVEKSSVFKKLDMTNIENEARKLLESKSFKYSDNVLKAMEKASEGAKSIADKVKADDLKAFIEKNKKAFGITETEPDKITKAVKDVFNRLSTKDKKGIIDKLTADIAGQRKIVDAARNELQTFSSQFNSTAKSFGHGAEKFLSESLGKFKWNQAGKFAAITGAIALGAGILYKIGGKLFGGKS
jgi:hypothetical protein